MSQQWWGEPGERTADDEKASLCDERSAIVGRTGAHIGETTAAGTTSHCLTPPR
jgi:hypothetical protein